MFVHQGREYPGGQQGGDLPLQADQDQRARLNQAQTQANTTRLEL